MLRQLLRREKVEGNYALCSFLTSKFVLESVSKSVERYLLKYVPLESYMSNFYLLAFFFGSKITKSPVLYLLSIGILIVVSKSAEEDCKTAETRCRRTHAPRELLRYHLWTVLEDPDSTGLPLSASTPGTSSHPHLYTFPRHMSRTNLQRLWSRRVKSAESKSTRGLHHRSGPSLRWRARRTLVGGHRRGGARKLGRTGAQGLLLSANLLCEQSPLSVLQ